MTFFLHLLKIILAVFNYNSWFFKLDVSSKKETVKILYSKSRMLRRIFRHTQRIHEDVKNLRPGDDHTLRVGELKFSFTMQASDRMVQGFNHELNEIFIYDIYQYKKVHIMKDDTILDCGANIGMFSVHASQLVGPGGKVYAFEPGPEEVDSVKKNLQLNNITNVDICAKGIWNEVTTKKFLIENSWANRITDKEINSENLITIKTIDIDSFIVENSIKKINFIKMDIEGAEYQALEGAREVLRTQKPKLALSLYHNTDDYIKLPKLINDINPDYRLYIKNNHGTLMLYGY